MNSIEIPPQNIEYEKSLLANMILMPESIFEIMSILKPDDFYRTAHQVVFEALTEMQRKELQIDSSSLFSFLKDTDKLKIIGNNGFFADILESPVCANAKQYAENVAERSLTRRLMTTLYKGISKLQDANGDALSVVNTVKQSVFDIQARNTDGAIAAKDIFEDCLKDYEWKKNHPGITGIESGYYDIDSLTNGFQPSNLIVLAARPSMGKTGMLVNCSVNCAKQGIPVLIFSLEMSKKEIINRHVSVMGKIDTNRIRSGLREDDWAKVNDIQEAFHKHLKIFVDDTALDCQQIETISQQMVNQYGIKIIFIDYLQLMKSPKGYSTNDEISKITRSLKFMAKRLGVPVVLLSQLNRNLEQRPNKRPIMADLRDSGSIEQDADLVAFLFREHYYNKTAPPNECEFNLAKHRNGPTGIVKLFWEGKTTRFENLDRNYE